MRLIFKEFDIGEGENQMGMSYRATQDSVGFVRMIRRFINGLGNRCQCCICGRSFLRFSKYRGGWQAVSSYLRELKWTGSDFDNFWCPFCRSHDRERHLMLYFKALGMWEHFAGAAVLHIAPEKHISRAIESCSPASYVRGDLIPSREQVRKLDVMNLIEKSESYDFVICNHVLEHVPDDSKALSEIFRVLKKGGSAVLQTPYAAALHSTRENDPSVTTEAERLKFYGQEDHVRLYGIDLFERIRNAGFILHLHEHSKLLAGVDCARAGVNAAEPLFLAIKPER